MAEADGTTDKLWCRLTDSHTCPVALRQSPDVLDGVEIPMRLYSRKIGSGPPILILHGLFGMSDNWVSIAKALASQGFTVYIPDLRNHGRSPHAETHRYTDMCDDILAYLEENSLLNISVIGHSMGGKLAMILSLLHPELVDKLVVVDIAPSDYRKQGNTFHLDLIDTLLAIDLTRHNERSAIRALLEAQLDDQPLAMFLAKNIHKRPTGNGFEWRCNLPVLKKYLQHLYTGLEELDIYAPCPVTTLFIQGELSDYYRPEHEPDRLHFFPASSLVTIKQADHWVHSQQPGPFLNEINQFLFANQ